MGNFGSADAATLTENDREIVPYILPTTIGMSPVNVREKGSSWNGTFTLSFGGGNGTYRWNFTLVMVNLLSLEQQIIIHKLYHTLIH